MAEVAYKPLGTIRPTDADYKTILQVPNYDDKGISYKGYSKKKISGSDYQLDPQFPRRISWLLSNSSAGSNLTSNRPNWETKKLYITGIQFHWKLTSGIFPAQVHIADVDQFGGAVVKCIQYFLQTGEQNIFLDLKDHPIEFKGKLFDIYTQMSISASDQLQVQIFGWEE